MTPVAEFLSIGMAALEARADNALVVLGSPDTHIESIAITHSLVSPIIQEVHVEGSHVRRLCDANWALRDDLQLRAFHRRPL
jgi:hypothetical protein